MDFSEYKNKEKINTIGTLPLKRQKWLKNNPKSGLMIFIIYIIYTIYEKHFHQKHVHEVKNMLI